MEDTPTDPKEAHCKYCDGTGSVEKSPCVSEVCPICRGATTEPPQPPDHDLSKNYTDCLSYCGRLKAELNTEREARIQAQKEFDDLCVWLDGEDRYPVSGPWRPIETAPKDAIIQGWSQRSGWYPKMRWSVPYRQWQARSGGEWLYTFPEHVTHWQPLPAPPGGETPMSEVGTAEYYDTRIDCAAIRCGGLVWTGKRHHHCIATIKQATGKKAHEFSDHVQGFVTMSGRFVDRKEAASLVRHTKQVPDFDASELFSEDLY